MGNRYRRIATAIGALFVGGLLIAGCARDGFGPLQDGEDRPPIIVRGGSLMFESGNSKRRGKWAEVENSNKKQWEFDHAKGKKTSRLQVYFVGGTGSCSPETTEGLTVYYDDDGITGTAAKLYTININKAPKKGFDGPMVSGENLTVDSAGTTLTVGPSIGKLESVKVGGAECAAPTEVWVESLK